MEVQLFSEAKFLSLEVARHYFSKKSEGRSASSFDFTREM